MLILFYALASVAAAIHVLFFVVESILWGTPQLNKRFRVDSSQAEANKLFAFNQGFYNLFLAAAVAVGIGARLRGYPNIGDVLVAYACVSMVGAGAVLWASAKHLRLGATVQALPPLLALGAWAATL